MKVGIPKERRVNETRVAQNLAVVKTPPGHASAVANGAKRNVMGQHQADCRLDLINGRSKHRPVNGRRSDRAANGASRGQALEGLHQQPAG